MKKSLFIVACMALCLATSCNKKQEKAEEARQEQKKDAVPMKKVVPMAKGEREQLNLKDIDGGQMDVAADSPDSAVVMIEPLLSFVDFEATYNGKTSRLSDYVGRGKYVLVDFWASWCGPCIGEIPHLIDVYNRYGGEDFTVLGVATWDELENTLAAIERLGIPYPQMLNAQTAGSDAYGIEGIPEIILFAPDGSIVARGLRGEQIAETVKKALGVQ